MPTINTITPCLWFDTQAEEAARFYAAIFPNSKLGKISCYGEAGKEIHGKEPGTAMTVAFELAGLSFTALNGGPHFKFTEAISLQVSCQTQEEVDRYWDYLSAGGEKNAQQCGWLKDKFGLSWQIIPRVLSEFLSDPDPAKSARVMNAMLKMKKLDIAELKKAHAG